MIIPLLLIVATSELLDEYVIAPVLELIGTVVIANDASPYVLFAATTNDEAEKPDEPLFTVMTTLPLASVKFALAAWVIDIVDVPIPLIRRRELSKNETTAMLLLEKVNTFPPLVSVFVVDGASLKDGFP